MAYFIGKDEDPKLIIKIKKYGKGTSNSGGVGRRQKRFLPCLMRALGGGKHSSPAVRAEKKRQDEHGFNL